MYICLCRYKLSKSWHKAAEVFEKLSTIYEKLDSKHESAQALVDAAAAYKKVRCTNYNSQRERERERIEMRDDVLCKDVLWDSD